MDVKLTSRANGTVKTYSFPGTSNSCVIVPTKEYSKIALSIFPDANDYAHTVNVFAIK